MSETENVNENKSDVLRFTTTQYENCINAWKNEVFNAKITERRKLAVELTRIALDINKAVDPWLTDAGKFESLFAHIVKKQENAELDVITSGVSA
jgi:hypothetical protein